MHLPTVRQAATWTWPRLWLAILVAVLMALAVWGAYFAEKQMTVFLAEPLISALSTPAHGGRTLVSTLPQ